MKLYKDWSNEKKDPIEKALGQYKGFVTIATGSKKYHKMAYILMSSYKLTSNNPYRFAIITDKETEYTDKFDDVIIVKNATKTYMDKIDLLINSPYKESIFIDADSIIYNDLNKYWDIFEKSSDFSAFGRILPIDNKDGWFSFEKSGKYKDEINNILDIHGGIYYLRKGEICNKIYEVSQEIIKNYDDFSFRKFKKPADEPILALAMEINNCNPIVSETKNYAWLRRTKKIKADFFRNKLKYRFGDKFTDEGMLMHFGTSNTIMPLYLIESKKVLFLQEKGREWNIFERNFNYILSYLKSFFLIAIFCYIKIFKKLKI